MTIPDADGSPGADCSPDQDEQPVITLDTSAAEESVIFMGETIHLEDSVADQSSLIIVEEASVICLDLESGEVDPESTNTVFIQVLFFFLVCSVSSYFPHAKECSCKSPDIAYYIYYSFCFLLFDIEVPLSTLSQKMTL